jgi:hypothetical protein
VTRQLHSATPPKLFLHPLGERWNLALSLEFPPGASGAVIFKTTIEVSWIYPSDSQLAPVCFEFIDAGTFQALTRLECLTRMYCLSISDPQKSRSNRFATFLNDLELTVVLSFKVIDGAKTATWQRVFSPYLLHTLIEFTGLSKL